MITVAVEAGGADLGPREVAAGAARAVQSGIGVLLFGPAEEIGPVADGVEVVDAFYVTEADGSFVTDAERRAAIAASLEAAASA